MAKNKKQKRKAKLIKRQQRTDSFKSVNDLFRIDKQKLENTFPDKQKRLQYLKALIIDFDRMIGV